MCIRDRHGTGKFFGPYTSAGAVKETIELLCKLYKVRTCNRRLPKDIGKDRPCPVSYTHLNHKALKLGRG